MFDRNSTEFMKLLFLRKEECNRSIQLSKHLGMSTYQRNSNCLDCPYYVRFSKIACTHDDRNKVFKEVVLAELEKIK